MDKIIIVPTPRDIRKIYTLLIAMEGVYTREHPEHFEEPGKAFVRVAFGRNKTGTRKVEVNAFTGTQVNMQIADSIRMPLVTVYFESFWDKVMDEIKAWLETGTDVTFDQEPVLINRDKNMFTLKGGRILFTFDDIRKLAATIGCMLIMFTVSAQVPTKPLSAKEKEEQYSKEVQAFREYVDKVLVPNTNYYSQQTVPTGVNIRIPASPKTPKLQSSGVKLISIAPIYTSQFESTIRITSSGGGRKDD